MKKIENEKLFITPESINLSEYHCDALYNMGKELITQDRNICINYAINAIISNHNKILEHKESKNGQHKDKTDGEDIFNS
jgi:hypothetical protein